MPLIKLHISVSSWLLCIHIQFGEKEFIFLNKGSDTWQIRLLFKWGTWRVKDKINHPVRIEVNLNCPRQSKVHSYFIGVWSRVGNSGQKLLSVPVFPSAPVLAFLPRENLYFKSHLLLPLSWVPSALRLCPKQSSLCPLRLFVHTCIQFVIPH